MFVVKSMKYSYTYHIDDISICAVLWFLNNTSFLCSGRLQTRTQQRNTAVVDIDRTVVETY